jgi:hypothetical protein
MEKKIDFIYESMQKTEKSKEPTQEEKEEQLIKDLTDEIDEIKSLIQKKKKRVEVQEEIRSVMQKISENDKEKPPYLIVPYADKTTTSGKHIHIQRRTTHLFDLDTLYDHQHLLHKYPEDWHGILHIKAKEKNELVKKRNSKYNSDT